MVPENTNTNLIFIFQDHFYYPLISEGIKFQTESLHTWNEPGSFIISSAPHLIKPILFVILFVICWLLGLQRSVVLRLAITEPSRGILHPLWKGKIYHLAISAHAYCCSWLEMEDPNQLLYHSAKRRAEWESDLSVLKLKQLCLVCASRFGAYNDVSDTA